MGQLQVQHGLQGHKQRGHVLVGLAAEVGVHQVNCSELGGRGEGGG